MALINSSTARFTLSPTSLKSCASRARRPYISAFELHVLLDMRRLSLDLRFQAIQTAVGHSELLTKIFTELIDALAHNEVSCL
jgi:hypothetical protein